MKRSDLEKGNLTPNFIGSWIIEPTLCEEIIEYFEKNKHKQIQGLTSGGLNQKFKDRQDITLSPKELKFPKNKIYKEYFEILFNCYKDYNLQWPFLSNIVSHLDIGNFNLGKYEPGQHFQRIHCERSGLNTLHRLFAFMTYLNNVEEGGSTYFNHYDLEIQPKKGLTLIWPAEWTHAHRGNTLISGSKYIITGWIHFAT